MSPRRGDKVTVRWPGGLYDFVIEFEYAEAAPPHQGSDGWLWLSGMVVEPAGPEHRSFRTFYVQPVAGGAFSLLPKITT